MKIAITGAGGFIGGRLAASLEAEGHTVVRVTRNKGPGPASASAKRSPVEIACGLDDVPRLAAALAGCDAVAHCAGINREWGRQTYARVHVAGTRHVVAAAQQAGVKKIVFVSFLRARPGCGSAYHESKWAAEEIVRAAGLDYTIVKPGVVYGQGDHMLAHLSQAFLTFPVFGLVGLRDQPVRPLALEDLVRVLRAALVEAQFSRETIAVTGPEEMTLREAVQRVARVVGRRPWMVRLPVWTHFILARVAERVMRVPLVSLAQVRILSEGVVVPCPPCGSVTGALAPQINFSDEQIRRGLPTPRPLGLAYLRGCARAGN